MTLSKRKLWPFCQPVLPEFPVFLIETYRNKTVVILEFIDQLPQKNLARVHNLTPSFDINHKDFNFFHSSCCFYYILLFVYCSLSVLTFGALSEVQEVH